MDDNHVSGSTLEEGRNALNELERYLKEKNLNQFPEIGNGKQQMEDRKLLDHKPRGERLKHIKGSPLGLTLEELDDRGLIDGGGSLPSHSSSIQRGRRQLEMRQRSSRMRDRASGYPKPLQSFFHMIRLLSKRGLNVEEYCRHRDPDNRGIMGKRQFASMLRKLSLPFGTRELNDVKNRYTIINTDQVDYEAMLRDAGVLDNTDVGGEIEGESMDGQGTNIGLFSSIIYELKNMLTDSMESLGKTPEDVYHMFAQWDPEGTGTVTSTQFLRVLTRMHVVLNDNDQDFIVELLDLDHMGKVYYDGILNYCFGDNYTRDGSTSSVSYSISSPQHQHRKGASGGGDDNTNNETLSNISQGSGVLIDIGGGVVIPGGHEQGESNYSSHNNLHSVGASRRPHTASRVPAEIIAFDNLSPLRGEGELSRSMVFQDKPTLDPASASFAPNRIQRPLTAAARVSSNYKQNYPVGQGQQHANARAAHSRGRPESAKQYVVEVSDDNDVINDDDYDAKNQINYADQLPRAGSDGQQYYHRNVSFLGALSSQDPNFQSADAICRQYLQSLRQVIINRTRGNPLNEGYLHDVFNQLFDQEGTLFFQQRGLVAAVRELLNADLQPPVADAAIKHLAIDSGDRVTFSEFAVFVMDPNMSSLEDKLQQHCASQFLVLGRDFQSYLFGSLWSDSAKQGELGQVSTRKFVECLNKLGNGEFSQDDIIRLVLRFDVHGSGHCDIARFLRVITKGQQWKQAEKMVAYQEDAAEEAETIRKNIQMGQQYSFMGSNSAACEDFISMAEYLGIKLLSERHLHWIVHEALSAPLPENWVNQTSNNGDTYYFNALTNKSQYAHPLDSYFFNLIEEYRNNNGGAPHHLQNHGGNNGGQMPSGSSSNYHSTDRDLQQPGGYGNSLPAKYSEGVYGPGLPGAPGAASGAGNGSAHTPVFPNPHQHKDPSNTHSNFYKNDHSASSSGKLNGGSNNNSNSNSRPVSGSTGNSNIRPVSANLQASLQSLMQGTMPQQQMAGAASESSLRKKFSQMAGTSTQAPKTTNYSQIQEKHAANFAKVGYYDHYGTFHKAAKKIRPVSGYVNVNPPPNPQNISMVDRALALNAAKDDSERTNALSASNSSMPPKRAVSAGRMRPHSSTGIPSAKAIGNPNVSKRLDEMYSNSIIGKLDAVMQSSGGIVAVHTDKAKISLEHKPVRPAKGGIVILGSTK